MAHGRILRAVDSVLRNLRYPPVRSSVQPLDLRAECEMLEERRLFNNVTILTGALAPPYYSAYLNYSYLVPETDCCGQTHLVLHSVREARISSQASFYFQREESASPYPVRYADGQPIVDATDLSSDGFGKTWGRAEVGRILPGRRDKGRM